MSFLIAVGVYASLLLVIGFGIALAVHFFSRKARQKKNLSLIVLPAFFFILCLSISHAADSTQIALIRKHYSNLKDERQREQYILDLLALRTKLVARGGDDWLAVEKEIIQYPAPPNSDTMVFNKARIGYWRSPRHDYLYRADGTWIMLPSPPCTTNGTWSIKGNQEVETVAGASASSTIILLSAKVSILTDAAEPRIFIETRLSGPPN